MEKHLTAADQASCLAAYLPAEVKQLGTGLDTLWTVLEKDAGPIALYNPSRANGRMTTALQHERGEGSPHLAL